MLQAALLTQTLQRAPYLFNAAASSNVLKKRKRGTGTPAEASLEQTYPDLGVQKLLQDQGDIWISDPRTLIRAGNALEQSLPEHCDNVVRIYLALNHLDQNHETIMILRRIHCVAFSQLHPKGHKIEDITSRILRTGSFFTDKDKGDIKQRVYKFLQFGYKWQKIIDQCRGFYGALCVLGKGYL